MAARFESMLSWEHSDHPVAVWNVPPSGHGVDGVNILTLNEHYADACVGFLSSAHCYTKTIVPFMPKSDEMKVVS